MTVRATIIGLSAALLMLALYGVVVSVLSGWGSMLEQFRHYWYFLVPLWVGFGVQIGLYSALRQTVRSCASSRAAVTASGTTSTAAILACCTHYLGSLVPALSLGGLVSIVAHYQTELFGLALAANLFGLAAVGKKLAAARRHRIFMAQAGTTNPHLHSSESYARPTR